MITITNGYALESDGERNYTVVRTTYSEKDGKMKCTNIAYHSNLGGALYCILRKETKTFVKSKKGKELRAMADEIKEFERQLVEELLERASAICSTRMDGEKE